jgi:hypothetical protein
MFKFDNSLLSDFAKCIALSIVKHVLGRQGRRKANYGDFGNVMHSALEHHFSSGSEPGTMGIFEAKYDALVPEGESPEDAIFERENMRKITKQFVKTRPVEKFPFIVKETEKVVGVEIADGLMFHMKRDALVEEKATGMICPMDHKTRWGSITEWWTKKFRMSSQFSGYIWGTREVSGGMGNKVYVNALSMAKLPDSNRKCKIHKMPYSECQLEHCDFQLLVYSRSEEQLEEWKRTAIFLAKQAETYFKAYGDVEMLKYAPRLGGFNESCTFCEFANWCKGGFDPEMMEEETVYKPWKPWDGIEDGVKVEKGEIDRVNEVGYHWIWDEGTGKIFPSEKLISGKKILPPMMAMKKLWDMGRDAWMEVWGMGISQEEMAEFARGQMKGGGS